MKIGDVARRTDVSVAAIRYYERLGLVPQAPRSHSGYRRFDEDSVRRLRFIQRAQALGFSLEEIGELLSLQGADDATAADVAERAAIKLADIEAKITDLAGMRDSLRALAGECCGEGPTSQCSILGALQGR